MVIKQTQVLCQIWPAIHMLHVSNTKFVQTLAVLFDCPKKTRLDNAPPNSKKSKCPCSSITMEPTTVSRMLSYRIKSASPCYVYLPPLTLWNLHEIVLCFTPPLHTDFFGIYKCMKKHQHFLKSNMGILTCDFGGVFYLFNQFVHFSWHLLSLIEKPMENMPEENTLPRACCILKIWK